MDPNERVFLSTVSLLTDPIFDDMEMPDADDRRRFMIGCRRSFSKIERGDYDRPEFCSSGQSRRITEFGDWKNLVKLLVVAGFVNFHSDHFEHDILSFHPGHEGFFTNTGAWEVVTKCGRIEGLVLWGHLDSYQISPCIRHLDHLKSLFLESEFFQFVPLDALSMLPRLEILHFNGVGEFHIGDESQHDGLTFPGVKKISIESFLSFDMLRRCTGLKCCHIGFRSESEIKRYLEILRSPDSRFSETLEEIEINIYGFGGCGMDVSHLKTLFFQVLPSLSNLAQLGFHGDGDRKIVDIMDFVEIANEIRSGKLFLTSPIRYLERVYFREETLTAEDLIAANEDPELQAAIPTFLTTFRTIVNMEFPRGINIHSNWEYSMIQNLAGWTLKIANIFVADRSARSSNNLPLSAWPIILQHFQRDIDDGRAAFKPSTVRESWWEELLTNESKVISSKATGIYYLLQEGSALIGRSDLNGRPKESPSPARKRAKTHSQANILARN